MDQKKIVTFMKVSDYNLELLPREKRELKGNELVGAIIENIRKDFGNLPGSLNISIEENIIITEYDPYEFSESEEKRFSYAINLLTERNFEKGQQILEDLIEDHPLNAALLYNLGMCYSEQGLFQKSIKPLEKAIELMPYYSEAFTALGYSYIGVGEIQKAIKSTERAIELNNENFYAHRNMASLYGQMNDYETALEYVKRALNLKPDDPSANYAAALTYKELGNNNKTKEYLNRIIDNGIDDRFVQYARKLITEITSKEFEEDDIRMDAVMYLIAAIDEYENMSIDEVREVAFEVGLKGRNGFKVDEPDVKYKIDKLGKECSGLQMVCYMYAGFKIIEPTLEIGFELEKEYEMAKKMRENGI